MKISKSSFNSIQSKLSKFNFFGLDFPIRYKKEPIFSSYIGITFSFLAIILIILNIIKYTIDLFKYSNFRVISNQIDLDTNKSINFSESPIMLGLSNIIGVPLEIQEKYFKFKMIKTTISPIHENNNFVSLNIYERYIEFDSCDILKKYYNMSIFEGFDFEKYLCPKPYQNISIRGRYGDGKRGFDILSIFIDKCVNSSNNNYSCASNDEINKILNSNSFLSVYFMKETPDHYNIKNPVKRVLRTDYFPIFLELRKLYIYNFIISEYYTDSGLIFSNKEKYLLGEVSNYYMDLLGNTFPNSQIGVIFTCVEYQIEYNRNYDRIYDIFSKIGGTLSFIFEIFQSITCYLTRKSFIADLTNSFFKAQYSSYKKKVNTFDLNKVDNNIINIVNNKKSEISSKQIFLNNKEKLFFNKEMNERRIVLNQYSQTINKKKHNYSFISYFIPFFFIKKINKYHILNITSDYYDLFMTLENIIPIIERFPYLLKYCVIHLKFSYENEIFKYPYYYS